MAQIPHFLESHILWPCDLSKISGYQGRTSHQQTSGFRSAHRVPIGSKHIPKECLIAKIKTCFRPRQKMLHMFHQLVLFSSEFPAFLEYGQTALLEVHQRFHGHVLPVLFLYTWEPSTIIHIITYIWCSCAPGSILVANPKASTRFQLRDWPRPQKLGPQRACPDGQVQFAQNESGQGLLMFIDIGVSHWLSMKFPWYFPWCVPAWIFEAISVPSRRTAEKIGGLGIPGEKTGKNGRTGTGSSPTQRGGVQWDLGGHVDQPECTSYILYIDHLGLYDKLYVSKASIKPAPIPFFLHLTSGIRRRKAASAANGSQKRKKRVKEVAVKAMPTKLPWMMVKLVKDLGNPWKAWSSCLKSALCSSEGGRFLDWFCGLGRLWSQIPVHSYFVGLHSHYCWFY